MKGEIPMAHPGGRPLMFQSAEELQAKIDAYFASCWEEVWEHITIKDKQGNIAEDKWMQQFDREGKPLMKLRERPTITGLALALDTTRATLMEYEERDNELSVIIKRAKTTVEYYYEQGAAAGEIHPAVGIFALKNFNWTDVIQINTKTPPEQLTPDEIKQRLQEKKQGRE
jgi:hypothetical protein